MFHGSFGYFILGKTIPEVQFYALKLDMSTFCACNKICIKVAAVSNDIKITYFREIDFECNLFNQNSSITEITRNNQDLNKNKNNCNTQ